ncbi:hypothetical protein VTO42DRAFT_8412 [Malbranchea cinnamomea]
MGAGGSKETGQGAGSRHIFRSDTAVQFSQGLVDSLQSSSETDASRAKTLELHIQERVAMELERIRAREKQTLADLEKRLQEVSETESSQSNSGFNSAISLDAPRVPFAGPGSVAETTQTSEATPVSRDIDSKTVKQEIDSLRAKLAERRKVRELDSKVEKAREDVVNCLRENERRPLDCWQEVDAFKKEVARLERDWVEKIVS